MKIHLAPWTRGNANRFRLPLAFMCICPSLLFGQQPAGAGARNASLPESPQPKQPLTSKLVESAPTFIGYMTNRSIFFPDIATSAGPLTVAGKFKLFVNESISPAYVLQSSIAAAYGQAINYPKGYGQGWDAYGERFGASMARDSSSSFFGTFVFASVLREDPRFFPQSHPTFWGSVKYSARRLFVTRSDFGHERFNTSGLLGPLAGETLANVYLPAAEQTGAKTAERYGVDLGWRFAGNMFKNYWPTFFHSAGLNRLKVLPNPEVPEAEASSPKM